MKFSLRKKLGLKNKTPHRKLIVRKAGKWFLAMTVALGVVAISSGNNILYLLESFLLGGIILSGVLSEFAVYSLKIRWRHSWAYASGKSGDEITLENPRSVPFFCVEVGEWIDGYFHSRAFAAVIPPKSTVRLKLSKPYSKRGWIDWQGIGVATRFPFGFADKVRIHKRPGKRLVWPNLGDSKASGQSLGAEQEIRESHEDAVKKGAHELLDGQIKNYQVGDDFRDILWFLEWKSDEPVMRVRGNSETPPILKFDGKLKGKNLEREISDVAASMAEHKEHGKNPLLEIWTEGGIEKISDFAEGMDHLATFDHPKESA